MNRKHFNRKFWTLTLSVCLGLVFTYTTAQAQEARQGLHLPTLPCCKCVGERTMLSLNTGSNPGSANWTVTPGTGPTPTTLSAWTASAPPAQWIQPVSPATSTANPSMPATLYTYTVAFNIQNCTIPYKDIQWHITWAADNNGTLTAPGLPPDVCPTAMGGGTCFRAPVGPRHVNGHWNQSNPLWFGTHSITVAVTNVANSYSGLLVNAQLTAECTQDLVQPMNR